MKNTRKLILYYLLFLFLTKVNAQQGFRMEVTVGPTLSDSSELYSFALQGNFRYLFGVSKNIDVGLITGAYVFLGKGSGSVGLFDSIPDVYFPLAFAFRAGLLEKFSVSIDSGYGFNAVGGGGLYFRPLIAYNLKEKVALIGSYNNINDSGYNVSSTNIGVNFGF
jgi:hypothetical protein